MGLEKKEKKHASPDRKREKADHHKITSMLMVAAAARVLWYQVYGLDGPVFPLDR